MEENVNGGHFNTKKVSVSGVTVAFVKLLTETQNVAWKHNEDEGIWAAFTHLIVRPEWRSSPRREVWPTSELKPGYKSQSSEKGNKNKTGERRIYTRKWGSHYWDKEAHLDDFLVVWSGRGGGGGERRGGGGGGEYTVVERACQLQSLSHIWFLRQKKKWRRRNSATPKPKVLPSHQPG